MPDPAKTDPAATPAMDAAAINKAISDGIAASLPSLLEKATAPLLDKITALEKAAAAPPPPPAGDAAKKDEAKAKALTLEDVQQLLAKDREAQTQSADAAARKQGVRSKVVEAKLKGVNPLLLASLPDTDDEVKLTAAAEQLAAAINATGVKPPNLGGAGKDGGTPPAGGVTGPTAMGLSDGIAKFAAAIKLPTPATSASPAATT